MIGASLFASTRGSWNTPHNVLDLVRRFDRIGLDPCSNADSVVGATASVSVGGLELDWSGYGLVYCNPEYGAGIGDWMAKCATADEAIALVPARTDTAWFKHCWEANAICFWSGRLKFIGAPSCAPFPSALVYWGKRRKRFARVFSAAGRVVFP